MILIYNSAYLTTTKNTPQLIYREGQLNNTMRMTIILLSLSICNSQVYDYSLVDINTSSSTFGETISPEYFQGQVTLHYFGHQD